MSFIRAGKLTTPWTVWVYFLFGIAFAIFKICLTVISWYAIRDFLSKYSTVNTRPPKEALINAVGPLAERLGALGPWLVIMGFLIVIFISFFAVGLFRRKVWSVGLLA